MKTSKLWMLLMGAFLAGAAIGSGITWAIGFSSDSQFEIVEGYTTKMNNLEGDYITASGKKLRGGAL